MKIDSVIHYQRLTFGNIIDENMNQLYKLIFQTCKFHAI